MVEFCAFGFGLAAGVLLGLSLGRELGRRREQITWNDKIIELQKLWVPKEEKWGKLCDFAIIRSGVGLSTGPKKNGDKKVGGDNGNGSGTESI